MAEILSQAEIEALLSSLSEDGSAISTPAPPVREPASSAPATAAAAPRRDSKTLTAYEAYDFRRPDKFAKDQLRTLQMLHETFARMFASSLSGYLRVPVHVDLISVEQIPYEEYMRSLTSSIITIFSMAPLAGQALLELEFNVVLSMLDRLLGGPGSMTKNTNILTDIEKALTDSIVGRALNDLQVAWEGIAHITPKRESMETQSQFVQIVPPNDVVVSILYEIKVGDMRGAMSFCVPYLLLKPITPKLSAQRWFAATTKKNSGRHAAVLARRLEGTHVTCAVRLGHADLSLDELLRLKAGDIVPLDRTTQDDIDVLIGNNVKFTGKPGIRGKKLAVYVQSVSAPVEFDEMI